MQRVKRAALSLLLLVTLLTACGPAKTDSAHTNAKFPGYQQVGNSGEAAQLWFNPREVQRQAQGYVVHALKTLPDGYARFDVLTNCQDKVLRQGGTEYNNDGTAKQDYPGNPEPVLAKSEPGMGPLMEAACAAALAAREIPGDFSVPAALELLYGPYDAQVNAARWANPRIPSDLPGITELTHEEGKPFLVRGVATEDFNEGGKPKKVLVTSAVQQDGDCHACSGLLGVTIFVNQQGRWKIDSDQPYVAALGGSGVVGNSFRWMLAGSDNYALIVDSTDVHQGLQSVTSTVFLRLPNGKLQQALTDGDYTAFEQEGLSADAVFLKGKNSQHFDFKLALTYTMPGQKTYVAEHRYEYTDKGYVLVKKDGPPKFTAPPGAEGTVASASSVPVTSPAKVPPDATGACSSPLACVQRMLEAAKSQNLEAAMAVSTALQGLPKPPRGARVTARKLNTEGLAALSSGNAQQAVILLTKAAAADPGDEEVVNNLAYAYSLEGDYTAAQAQFVAALALNPRRTSAWAPMALNFAKLHQAPRALEAMWLAYNFSADKPKTLDFLRARQQSETDPLVVQLYRDSLAWFEEGKVPADL